MIDTLLLFGVTGDLAGRYLMPALGALHEHGHLPRGFRVVGSAPRKISDGELRELVRDRLETHGSHLSKNTRDALPGMFHYRPVDFSAADLDDQVGRAVAAAAGPLAAYLALPPGLFVGAMTALAKAGLPDRSRIVVEKPFGGDLEQAKSLNALVARIERDRGKRDEARDRFVFRVDHVLGMPTVQNLIALRLANSVTEAFWSSAYIDSIEILWEETLALEDRAGYFDKAGALKDVMQNHMIQLLSLVAMDLPVSMDANDVADAKVAALRAVRPPAPADMRALTRRARYTAGTLTGDSSVSKVPDYVKEQGVDPKRATETFAEVVLSVDTSRWSGTRFVLRAGKALRNRRKEIVVHFRPVHRDPFNATLPVQGNALHIGIDGPLDLSLHLQGRVGSNRELETLALSGNAPASNLNAYDFVLLDVLLGDSTLAVRGDEAEEAWRIVTPVVDAWRRGAVPLEEYAAGSEGPQPLLPDASRRAA
jgi:glucose-6-phosphate 1-dehydrogenase